MDSQIAVRPGSSTVSTPLQDCGFGRLVLDSHETRHGAKNAAMECGHPMALRESVLVPRDYHAPQGNWVLFHA